MKKLPTWLEIDLDRLDGNLKRIRQYVGDGVCVSLTVKADAYGHGAVQVAQAAQGDVDMFGVATLDEAVELREAGIRSQILILSPILATEIPSVVAGGFAVTVSSFGIARKLSEFAERAGRPAPVHVEIDTGMGRTGISEEFGREEVTKVSQLPGVKLEGVYTHFPVSDTDPDYTRDQIARFETLIGQLRSDGVDIPLVHSANTAAVAGIHESHMNMVRPGLLAFGLHPSRGPVPDGVVPIMSWKSRMVRVRRIPAGRSISYGRSFVTERDSVIGVVPVGYGHGYPYRVDGSGYVLVGGERAPIVGRVTMDMFMVDLTDVSLDVEPGEEVTLVGRQGDETISFHEVADWAGTICYDVMCNISKRVPRTYFRRGRVETYKSLLGVIANHVNV